MSSVNITPNPTAPGDLCGPLEAAEILGVERTRVPRYHREGKMPDPVAVLKIGTVWLRADIEKMKAERDAEAERREKAKAARK